MEESIGLLELLKTKFECEDVDIRTFSPLTLAFVGDGIYEIIVRTVMVERGNRSVESLHKEKSRYVKAQTQAAMAESIKELMTPEEESVYRRGRNANIHSPAKNATMADYRKATGFEALCGYLYMQGKMERLLELMQEGFKRQEIHI